MDYDKKPSHATVPLNHGLGYYKGTKATCRYLKNLTVMGLRGMYTSV